MARYSRLAIGTFIFILLLGSSPGPLHADDGVETTGDILQVMLPVWAYGMTFAKDDPQGSVQFTQSFLTAMAATYATKLSVDRERPNGGNMSFPSGHTSAAFSGAAFIQMRYGWLYGSIAYAGATYVGWSRIETENHYVEDVIAGAGMGILSAAIFTKPYLDKIHILPFVSKDQLGMTLTVSW
jgi:membrane-associated phospholipid phosphatase